MKTNPPPTAAELRKQAEAIARQKTPPPENAAALSPDQVCQTLHELRVHQIELELQNEELRRAQRELETTHTRYFDLYDLAPVGYVTCSKQGLILEANLAATTLCGVPRSTLLKQPLSRYLHPEDANRFYLHCKQLFETEEPQTCELRMPGPDGAESWVQLTAAAAQAEDGSLLAHIALTDITQRKQGEDQIRRLADKLKLIYDTVPIGIGFLKGRTVVSANISHEKIYGYAPGETAGMPTLAFYADPEDYERVGREGYPVLARGETFHTEALMRRKDGSVFLCSMTGRAINPRNLDEGSIWQLEDITRRKQAETKLREAQDLLQAAMDHSPAGIAIADAPDGRLRYVNHAGLLIRGGDRQSIVNGVGVDQYVASWQLFELDGRPLKPEEVPLARAIRFGETNRREFIIRRAAGEDRIVSASAAPILDAQGKVTAGIVVFTDNTERKHIEDQLRQSQKMESIGHLAGGVAHDFNNILAAMFMQMDLLKMDVHEPADFEEGLKQLRAGAERAANLVRQLLLYSRRSMTQMRDLNLNEVVTNFSKMLRRILGEDLELKLNLYPQALPLRADAGMIEQVIMNLATNARDAMPGGGKLAVETAPAALDATQAQRLGAEAGPGNYVCLSVSDTGTGIPPEALPKIFEPFFTTKDVGKGTGLGLASVSGIVKQHKGGIEVDNHPGRGATFKIYFPAQAAPVVKTGSEAVPPPIPRGTETILLVEDEPVLRQLTRKVLAQHGYRVLEAANGPEALGLWQQQHKSLDLLLTDLIMPDGLTGRELAQQLVRENPGLKVIYMSGYSAEVVGKDFPLRAGVNYLAKPFEAQQLVQTIRNCLAEPAWLQGMAPPPSP